MRIKLFQCLFLLPNVCLYAVGILWQDVDNNAYLRAGYSVNTATINRFGSMSGDSGVAGFGATGLFDNNVYINLDLYGNFLGGTGFLDNWYNAALRIGYAINMQNLEKLNFIPYVLVGYGNEGAYFSDTANINYGLGLLSELIIAEHWSLFVDLNYGWQSFVGDINSDFNKTALNNYSSYMIKDPLSFNYSLNLGLKCITNDGYYFSPFFKYQFYQQTFNQSSGEINYGVLNPNVAQYEFGVSIGWVL